MAMRMGQQRWGWSGAAAAGAQMALALLAAALAAVSAAVPGARSSEANLVQYWGDLSFGASTALSSAQPVDLPGRLPFVALAAGRTHACGLLANGTAHCIGDNGRGALGVNASLPRSMAPLPVAGGLAFEALAAGWQFTCGQQQGGQLHCWGRNDFGQLCDGSTQDSAAPVRSAAGYLLAGTSAGGLHACAIDGASPNGSAAVCWGSNQLGQLTAEGFNPPAFISDQNGSAVSTNGHVVAGSARFVELAAGSYHTCGRTPPEAGGETYCFGANDESQTGNIFTSSRAAMLPVKVDYGDRKFVQLTAGAFHTCGIESGTLKAWCWGSNAEGQLGWVGPNSKRPVEVAGGHQWRQLSAGGQHTCGISVANGTGAWCWGSNSAAQLGSGMEPAALPNSTVPVQVVGGDNFTQVVAGWATTYGILGDATLELPGSPPPPPGFFDGSADASSSSFAVGAIVGIVAAVVLAVALAALLVWRRRKQQRLQREPAHAAKTQTDSCEGSKLASSSPWDPSTLEPGSSWTGSKEALSSDPVLSYIASHLATAPSGRRPSSTDPSTASGGRASSGALPALAEWQVDWNDIRLERQIGRGGYGRVYGGTWSGIPVAVKVLITRETFEDAVEGEGEGGGLQLPATVQRELQDEAMVLSRLRHPGCVTFFGICELPPAILTEYCSHGSLYDVIQAAKRQPEVAAQFGWRRRLSLAYDASVGLNYLHTRSPPVLHRDVKSPNLLVDAHWRCKVADFNLSKIFFGEQPTASSRGAPMNPTWLAPEVLSGEPATTASDAFSFGYVLWELMTWQLPWAGTQPFLVMKLVRQGDRPEMPPEERLPGPSPASFGGMGDYCQLIRDCWAQDPAQRPTAAIIATRLQALLDQLGWGMSEV